jgi:hypothetical protein
MNTFKHASNKKISGILFVLYTMEQIGNRIFGKRIAVLLVHGSGEAENP